MCSDHALKFVWKEFGYIDIQARTEKQLVATVEDVKKENLMLRTDLKKIRGTHKASDFDVEKIAGEQSIMQCRHQIGRDRYSYCDCTGHCLCPHAISKLNNLHRCGKHQGNKRASATEGRSRKCQVENGEPAS
jgi:hypothetical protein